MLGKSLTEHITDLVVDSLSNSDIKNTESDLINKTKSLEDRLLTLEAIVSNREYLSQKLKPFTNSEAINCTKFMRGLFDRELEKRSYGDKKEAFDELLEEIQFYGQLNKHMSTRFQEIMLSSEPSPWSGLELNEISGGDKCNCSIRKGLINWTGEIKCPSQQEICDRGEELLSLF